MSNKTTLFLSLSFSLVREAFFYVLMSMSRLILFSLILYLFLSLTYQKASSSTTPFTSGSRRSLLRAIADVTNDKSHTDYAVDLNAANFDSVLRDTPASYAIVEFFAHWCPACRNYKPQYEKVARLFNGPDAAHPGILLMTRVDCALKINNKLCDRFSVSHYPMLFWGPPSKFLFGGWEPNKEKSEIRVIEDVRPADHLLNWINKQLGSSYNFDDQKFENEHLSSNISDPGQIARAVYDVEEATDIAFEIIFEHKMIKSGTRASLIKFLQLLVAHHPSKRCRMGSSEMLVNFDDMCPQDIFEPDKQEVSNDGKHALANFHTCGTEVPRGYWTFCRGSKNETRGFSCGLWVLLHSLSVRIEDGESDFAFSTICDFIHNFFICEECRQHFYLMCSSVKIPFNSSREFALWLWNAHNKVNERLAKEEASLGTGDPNFPKIIWPPRQLCSSCYNSRRQTENGTTQIDWNLDEVYKLLTSYYGTTLASLYKAKRLLQNEATNRAIEDLAAQTTTAVMVPMGAAMAIALASCAFGALACYWRSRQKSRKPRRKLDL